MNAAIASTRAELLRLRKWPAVWVTLSGLDGADRDVRLPVQLPVLHDRRQQLLQRGRHGGVSCSARCCRRNVADVLVQGMPMFGGALMMVLGAIVAGSGYGWGTWKTVFTQGPSRTSATLGSLVALAMLVVARRRGHAGVVLRVVALVAAVESQAVAWPSAGDLAVSVPAPASWSWRCGR